MRLAEGRSLNPGHTSGCNETTDNRLIRKILFTHAVYLRLETRTTSRRKPQLVQFFKDEQKYHDVQKLPSCDASRNHLL